MLTAKEIIKEGLVTGVTNKKCIQQVGIDLELVEVSSVMGIGMILTDSTMLPKYSKIEPTENSIINQLYAQGDRKLNGWLLEPGYYEIKLAQGCSLTNDRTLLLRQRSSLLRSGVTIHSSIFDPGFATKAMGTFMEVKRRTFLEFNARVCQAYIHTSNSVENGYDGQYQNDKQR